MKDYIIKMIDTKSLTIYRTDNKTILLPANSNIQYGNRKISLELYSLENPKVGVLGENGNITIISDGGTITFKNVTFDNITIIGKKSINVIMENSKGNITTEGEVNIS